MEPLFVGPYTLGVQQNMKPFMVPEEAFPDMMNAYVFRGRVEKKAGYQLLGRLQRNYTSASLGNITSATATINLKSLLGITETTAIIASGFVITVGAPDSQTLTDNGDGTITIAPVNAAKITVATVNYVTGIITLTWGGVVGASAATFTGGYFPGLPVMGIRTYEIPTLVNDEQTIFFDTKYAYQYSAGMQELPSTLAVTWTGTDSQQFWSTNYQYDSTNQPLFWVTNNVPGLHQYAVTLFGGAAAGPPSTVNVTAAGNTFPLGATVYFVNLAGVGAANNLTTGTVTVAGDPIFTISNPGTGVFANGAVTGMAVSPNVQVSGDGIRNYNGTTWQNFNPAVNTINVVEGALLIVPYKGRLVLLSTWEGNSGGTVERFQQRARWSQNVGQGGDILDYNNGWRDDIAGRGGFDDAATNEAIISCGFVKDELIVYFEKSTWKLIYTSNEAGQPFVWQRINSELGAESTFSAVQFDNGLIAFGNVGIHTSNGSAVERMDTAIPDEVFNAHNNVDGPLRTSGIRDFYQEIVYFAYADQYQNTPSPMGKIFYPNKMMIYNYRNNTFSFFNDNATAMGYFQRIQDTPWSQLTFPWSAWNSPWNSGVLDAQFPNVAFGNQQGFIEIIEPFFTSNASSLYVKTFVGNTVVSPQHNLFDGDYVVFHNCQGLTNVNDVSFQIEVVDQDTFTIDGTAVGVYSGNGLIEVPSSLKILTKQFTPFWSKGKRYELKYLDILVDRTDAGEIAVDVFVDFTDTFSMTDTTSGTVLGAATVSTAPEGTNLPYYSFQQQGAQIWKRFYTCAMGETFQVQFSFNDAEMRDRQKYNADVVVHAMIFHFNETGSFY